MRASFETQNRLLPTPLPLSGAALARNRLLPTPLPLSGAALAPTFSLHMRLSSLIFCTWLSMNFWPPKPGFTDMMSTRSTKSSTYSIVDRGVPGFSTTPAMQPSSLICMARSHGKGYEKFGSPKHGRETGTAPQLAGGGRA